jgi:hypothetical protein
MAFFVKNMCSKYLNESWRERQKNSQNFGEKPDWETQVREIEK